MGQLQPPDFRPEFLKLQLFQFQQSILGANNAVFGLQQNIELGKLHFGLYQLIFHHSRLILPHHSRHKCLLLHCRYHHRCSLLQLLRIVQRRFGIFHFDLLHPLPRWHGGRVLLLYCTKLPRGFAPTHERQESGHCK